MAERPAVSVLLPTFEHLHRLPTAVESIRAQGGPAWELVVVDDGSTDGTDAYLADLARGDPRVRVFSRPHSGLVAALNAGLARCRAPLVARMDADDESLPGRLAAQAAWLAAHPDASVAGALVAFSSSVARSEGMERYVAWQNGLVTHEAIVREIFVESPLVHPAVMFRRDAVAAVGGYRDRGWAEDYDLWLRLYAAGHRFGKVAETLLRWHDAAGRLTRVHPAYAAEQHLALKARFLPKTVLAGRDSVQVWGAGRDGKRLRKALAGEGVEVARFFDVDPRKVGGAVAGRVPVLPWRLLRSHRDQPTLVAVGSRGAREEIRRVLPSLGCEEGRNVWFVA